MDPELTQEMRHVPSLTEIIERVDVRLRTVASIVASSVEAGRAATPTEAAAATEFLTAAVHWLDRLSDHNRHFRRISNPHEAPISSRLQVAFDNAVTALRGLDEKQFRKRSNLHSFDKSHAEGVFGCVLAVGDMLHRAAEKASSFDRAVYASIYERVLPTPPLPELRLNEPAVEAGS